MRVYINHHEGKERNVKCSRRFDDLSDIHISCRSPIAITAILYSSVYPLDVMTVYTNQKPDRIIFLAPDRVLLEADNE